ncbi:MAG: DUF5615 family PIN-like protein [Acidobacteria bacterium]|nr:DUF5615 family PIN-like protein [Acidobacteriota bacterium]
MRATKSSLPRETSSRRGPFATQAAILGEQGHDAVAVVEAGLSGQPDSRIREFAIEQDPVLLTLDVDFANMLRFPPAGTPGVIRLKVHPPKEQAVREQIQRALALLKDTPLAGCLAVSRGDMVRIRS